MAEQDVGDGRQVDLQLLRVAEHRVLARPGVEQQPVAVDLDEGGEAPLADALVRQHGGEDR
jgi:hypothetical protein